MQSSCNATLNRLKNATPKSGSLPLEWYAEMFISGLNFNTNCLMCYLQNPSIFHKHPKNPSSFHSKLLLKSIHAFKRCIMLNPRSMIPYVSMPSYNGRTKELCKGCLTYFTLSHQALPSRVFFLIESLTLIQ